MPDSYSDYGSQGVVSGQSGSGIAQIASGLIGGITGLIQRHKAKKALAGLQYPTETIPQEVLQNQQLATLRANTGLPSEQYNQAMQNVARQQNAAIRGATDRRSGLLTIAQNQQQGNDAVLNLDVANAKARLGNEKTLMGVNNTVGAYRQKAWDWNVRQKYTRDYSYAQGLLGAGNQNFIGGLDKAASGILNIGQDFGKVASGLLKGGL